MQSKTVAVALQLRIPKNMKADDVGAFIRRAIGKHAEDVAATSAVFNLDRSPSVRLYKDRVEVFMP